MDEYTFLVLAKLKADRLRLERQARESAPVVVQEPEEARAGEHRRPRRARWFDLSSDWRLQS